MADLAKTAGLSVGTVSYAMRGDPSVSAKTIERVRTLAEQMGYRPDPRLASLMAHIRRGRQPRNRETLAWIWVSTREVSEYSRHEEYFLRSVYEGARVRAEQLGCALEPFWLYRDGMTPKRLHKILRTRGIAGVLLSPAMDDAAVTLDWDWSVFAVAIVGMTEWKPVLHRVGHDYYRSVWRSLQRLREEGVVCPAILLRQQIHERIHGMQFAAFQSNHPNPKMASRLVQFTVTDTHTDITPWPARLKPDALLIGWPVDAKEVARLRELTPSAKVIVTLDWRPYGGARGMNIHHDIVAASVVDQVMAQLHRNERGIPSHPTAVLLEGEWNELPATASEGPDEAIVTHAEVCIDKHT